MEVNETSQYKQMMSQAIFHGNRELLFPLLSKGRVENVLYRASEALRSNELSLELLRHNFARLDPNIDIIFPSHFFEFEHMEELLTLLSNRNFCVQISPGAELSDYINQIQKLSALPNFSGIELVMDRAPHEQDWLILKNILVARYVYCPIIEINPITEMEKIPANILQELLFFYPEKKKSKDSFLSPDAVFVLREKLMARGIRCETISYDTSLGEPIEKSEKIKSFLENPNSEFFLSQFPELGKNTKIRAVALRLAKNTLTAPLLWLPFGLIWLLNSPLAALMTLYWKIHDFFDSLYLRLCQLLALLRHAIIMSTVYSQIAAIRFFYFFYSLSFLFAHPIWTLKQYAPWIYVALIHPFFKFYWFTSFQFQKRFQRKNCDEN